MGTTVVATGAGGTTTVTETGGAAKGGKGVSIALIVLGALGLLLALIGIIYSAVGANLALEGSGVEGLQKKCLDSINKIPGSGKYECTNAVTDSIKTAFAKASKTTPATLCGLKKHDVACSFKDHKKSIRNSVRTWHGSYHC